VRCWFALVCLIIATPAQAGSSSGHASGDLKSSSGGTGATRSGGNGGTGVSTTANAPLSNLQSTFKPLHVTLPPPAGVRPHTDLAAAEKTTMLSSRRLIKRSALYNKIVTPHGDPLLVGPDLRKIAYPDGGGSSFKTLQGFTAAESKGEIYPTHGGTVGKHHDGGSLSSTAHPGTAESDAAEAADSPAPAGWLLKWLFNLSAVAGTCGLGWLMWTQAPRGARMTLPAKLAAI
jgi:hypothetical protein